MMVQQAVVPKLPLLKAIDDWEKIKYHLMENPRQRQLKIKL
jgi:hypothetical protein